MDKHEALDVALGQIERQFGKGSVMKMSDQAAVSIGAVSTGSLATCLFDPSPKPRSRAGPCLSAGRALADGLLRSCCGPGVPTCGRPSARRWSATASG